MLATASDMLKTERLDDGHPQPKALDVDAVGYLLLPRTRWAY